MKTRQGGGRATSGGRGKGRKSAVAAKDALATSPEPDTRRQSRRQSKGTKRSDDYVYGSLKKRREEDATILEPAAQALLNLRGESNRISGHPGNDIDSLKPPLSMM
eukprot:52576-Eustigmatos_ZCMA.PRE.1